VTNKIDEFEEKVFGKDKKSRLKGTSKNPLKRIRKNAKVKK